MPKYSGYYHNNLRCEVFAKYMISTGYTVRETAKEFGISKSTVHKDVTERLSKINPALYFEVRKILDTNKALRHIRGGEATKRRYARLKNH